MYNLGVSGDTSRGIAKRIKVETKPRIEPDEEVVIIVSVGTNDAIVNNVTKKHWVELSEFTENIEKIITTARTFTKRVIFVGIKPVDETKVDPIPWLANSSYKRNDIERYEQKLIEICKKNKIPFIDVYTPFLKQKNYQRLLPDGVHPSSEGHSLVYKNAVVLPNALLQ